MKDYEDDATQNLSIEYGIYFGKKFLTVASVEMNKDPRTAF